MSFGTLAVYQKPRGSCMSCRNSVLPPLLSRIATSVPVDCIQPCVYTCSSPGRKGIATSLLHTRIRGRAREEQPPHPISKSNPRRKCGTSRCMALESKADVHPPEGLQSRRIPLCAARLLDSAITTVRRRPRRPQPLPVAQCCVGMA
jgi:hypothetical protein